MQAIPPAELLADARRDFPAYYAIATPKDAQLLDGLVLAFAALTVAMNAPREAVAPIIRYELEKVTDQTERVFMSFRDAVRESPTFRALSLGERLVISQVVFGSPPFLD